MRFLLMLALLALPGCLAPGPEVPVAPASDDDAPGTPAAPATGPQVIVDVDTRENVPPALEADALCTFGGGVELPRAGGRVPPGVKALVATVKVPITGTGVQLGYRVDDGEATWLPVARPGQITTFRIPVPEGAHEAEGERWSFGQQHNVFAAPQDCYTGGSVSGFAILVEA